MSNLDLKILCVDDESAIVDLYESAVKSAGFTAILCTNPKDAIKKLRDDMDNIVLVISDYQMPGMNGFEFRKEILKFGHSIPFVIVSAFVSKEMAISALELKISAFADKPVDESMVRDLILKESKARLELIRESQALESTFIEEASNILEEIDPVLLSVDQDRSNMEKLNLIFRGAHTIKGSSGVLTCDTVTRYVHKLEDIISGVKKGQIQFTDEVYEIVLKGFDRIKELIAAVSSKTIRTFKLDELIADLELTPSSKVQGEASSQVTQKDAPSRPKQALVQKPKDSISVPISLLDELSGYSGEITVIRNMVNKILRSLEHSYAGNRDVQSLGELLDEMHKVNGTIQTRITDCRKVPLSGVVKSLPRIIRDLSRDLKKSITLSIEGDALRVDNSLASVCSNSLVHLVRNSADHGVEGPADRLAAGKSETGHVQIKCSESRDEIVISIEDDGRGINPEKIRARAVEKGLFTSEQLALMTEKDVFSIIFASGFSTAAVVSDVSGRGVGMDMVRSSVEAVGGRIEINSSVGRGSTFEMHLPIPKSVLIINSLVVESAGLSFAVPQNSIVRVIRIESSDYESMLQNAANGAVLRCDHELYSLVDLRDVLQISSQISRSTLDVVEVLLLRSEKCSYALRVDAILDSEEIVVKSICSYVNPKSAFSGATFMGDGTVGLILDVSGIADMMGLNASEVLRSAKPTDTKALSDVQVDISTSKNYLLFHLGSKALYGVPLEQVYRLEEIDGSSIQTSGAERVVIYRDGVMPIVSMENLLNLKPKDDSFSSPKDRISTIVAKSREGFMGLEVTTVVDIAASDTKLVDNVRDRKGVIGNAFIHERIVTIVDLPTVLGRVLTAS